MNKNNNKNLTILIVLIIVIFIGGLFLVNRQQNHKPAATDDQGMILFYSLSCPHCQNVEQYINDNKIKDKYNFQQLEISANQANSEQLVKKAQVCGLETQGLGVPFLWTGEKCLMGDADIIEFLKK